LSGGSDDSSGEKSHEPTEKKLLDARKKGDVAKSNDVSLAAGYLGLALTFFIAGHGIVNAFGATISSVLSRADSLSSLALRPGGALLISKIVNELLSVVAPIFVVPAVFILVALMAQQAIVYSPDKISPKLSRISILSSARNKFGPTGLFEFAKSFVKLAVISCVVGVFLYTRRDVILGSVAADARSVPAFLTDQLQSFFWMIFVITLVISTVDYMWQRFDHRRKLMMSQKDISDESKDAEGDPHIKQQRRQKGYDITMNRMISDVGDADVVIVNPEHYAIALKWDHSTESAPVCVAKGVDEIAARIREAASVAGVPIHRNPSVARAIYAVVEIGQEVHPDHYKPVAAAIRYAERIRKLSPRRRRK